MKIIAKKKQYLDIIYIISSLVFTAASVIALIYKAYIALAPCIMLLGVCIFILITYYRQSDDLICVDGDKIILPKGITLEIKRVACASCSHTRVRGIKYKYGTVYIHTLTKKYSVRNVENCADAASKLNSIIKEKNSINGRGDKQ